MNTKSKGNTYSSCVPFCHSGYVEFLKFLIYLKSKISLTISKANGAKKYLKKKKKKQTNTLSPIKKYETNARFKIEVYQ